MVCYGIHVPVVHVGTALFASMWSSKLCIQPSSLIGGLVSSFAVPIKVVSIKASVNDREAGLSSGLDRHLPGP